MELKTVLLVDDDQDVLGLMQLALELDTATGPLRVMCARNGAEAFALAVREPPHVIVTDLEMPVCTGAELIAQLRRHARLHHVPILLVSGSSQLVTIAAELDVQGWLGKPFEYRALSRAVLGFLRRDSPALEAAA